MARSSPLPEMRRILPHPNLGIYVTACALCGWMASACARPAHAPQKAPVRDRAPARTQAPAPKEPPPQLGPSEGGVAVGTSGAVVSAEGHASRVGLQVLKSGGNAVDAAVAVGFALAVTHPSAGNLGGGGFMLIRMADGTATAIDYRETASSRASPDMYLDKKGEPTRESLVGPRAAGIPGTVAGLALAHERFGTRTWAELVRPAVALARRGHAIDAQHAEELASGARAMARAGFEDSAKHYLGPSGRHIEAGETWLQPELGNTLAMLAERGPRSFYEGSFAKQMAEAVQTLGGLWTAEDLARYRAVERKPIAFAYLGHSVLSMPPPSAGGVVMRQILGASELLEFRQHPWRSPAETHLYVEATRRSYADRNTWLGDPDFADIPTDRLIHRDYIAKRMGDIDAKRATPCDSVAAGAMPGESMETTHFSVVDKAGNAVSNTYTLNTNFGSKLVVPGTGVLLNNEMDDFASKPGHPNVYGLVQGSRNRIQPGKRMLSSMSPTIVLKGDALRAVLGTPGGPTITTTVVQLIRALLDYGETLDSAMNAPRIHHQCEPDEIIAEPTIGDELRAGLEALGHRVTTDRWQTIGHAMCIEVDPKTGAYRAVADVSRGGGLAVAY